MKRKSLLNIWHSGHYLDVARVSRLELAILGHRLDHCGVSPCGVLGTGILFPESIGCRSCVPGASLPSTKILLSHSIRGLVRSFILQ